MPKPDQQLRQRIEELEATVEAMVRLLSDRDVLTRADLHLMTKAVIGERVKRG